MHNSFNRALMRTPAPNFGDGLTTQQLGAPDYALALQQYRDYADTLRACGLDVTVLPADTAYPDGHFVEDVAVIYRDLAVITRPGAPSRQGEVSAIAEHLSSKHRVYLDDDATLEGGDVLFCADRLLVGLSKRTNRAGADRLRMALQEAEPGLRVDFVPFSGVLHLKTGLTELAPGVLVRSPEITTDYAFDFAETYLLPAVESYAADVLPVNDAVLIPTGHPVVADLASRYYTKVYTLEMSEFQKMDGGLTCLSLRYRE
jgi:dimethylargininase